MRHTRWFAGHVQLHVWPGAEVADVRFGSDVKRQFLALLQKVIQMHVSVAAGQAILRRARWMCVGTWRS